MLEYRRQATDARLQNAFMFLTRIASLPFPLLLAFGQAAAAPQPLFAEPGTIQATITAPFRQIMDERDEDKELEGSFEYADATGNQRFDIKVRVRGKFRARKDICDFPPLRLNFKKKQVAGTLFDGQDKLKLVTHCQNSGSMPEQYVLREHLSYRFLASLTENAFRTRLLRVTYVDSEGRSKTRTKYAFLIESDDALAERLGAMPARLQQVDFDQLEPEQTNVVTVFGYFLGNTDFSAVRGPDNEYCCHNVELVEIVPGVLTPIPYDFDFSGMVDAPYASPSPSVGIRKVTTRIYRGLCRNNDLLPETLNRFMAQRQNFEELVEQQDGLNNKSRKDLSRYLAEFYEVLSDEQSVRKDFIDQCSAANRPRDPT